MWGRGGGEGEWMYPRDSLVIQPQTNQWVPGSARAYLNNKQINTYTYICISKQIYIYIYVYGCMYVHMVESDKEDTANVNLCPPDMQVCLPLTNGCTLHTHAYAHTQTKPKPH